MKLKSLNIKCQAEQASWLILIILLLCYQLFEYFSSSIWFFFDDDYWFNDNFFLIKIIKDDAIFSVTIVQYEYDFLC